MRRLSMKKLFSVYIWILFGISAMGVTCSRRSLNLMRLNLEHRPSEEERELLRKERNTWNINSSDAFDDFTGPVYYHSSELLKNIKVEVEGRVDKLLVDAQRLAALSVKLADHVECRRRLRKISPFSESTSPFEPSVIEYIGTEEIRNKSIYRHRVGLVPASYVDNADQIIQKWESFISNGNYWCDRIRCGTMSYGNSLTYPVGKIILYCSLSVIGDFPGIPGAPSACRVIALITNREKLIDASALYEDYGCAYSRGGPLHYIRLRGTEGINDSQFRRIVEAIKSTLSSPPFLLDTQIYQLTNERGHELKLTIEGVRSIMPSMILPGNWRETVTVLVDITSDWSERDNMHLPPEEGRSSEILIQLASTLYVSKTNVPLEQNTDWHLPARDQEEKYDNAFIKYINAALLTVCDNNEAPRQKFMLKLSKIECRLVTRIAH